MYHFSNQHRFLITATENFTVLSSNCIQSQALFYPLVICPKEKKNTQPTKTPNPTVIATHFPQSSSSAVCFFICGKLNLRTAEAQQNSGIACAYTGVYNAFHTFKLFHVLRMSVRASAAISSHSNSIVQINNMNLHIIRLPKYHRKFYVQQMLSYLEALGCILCLL